MKLFGVCFELSGFFYLYRDFVTVLAKIATTLTLMDKIKTNPQKWRKQTIGFE